MVTTTTGCLQRVIDSFEAQTKDAVRVQKEVLKKILEENGEAEYLRSLGLGGRTDPESFKACVPVVTHEDLQPYIQRVADGDPSPILTRKPITDMSLSSGTTQGKSKHVPFNEELFKSTMHVNLTSFAYRNRELPITKGKHLSFAFGSKVATTSGGITTTTATMHILRGEFSRATGDKQRLTEYCSPKEVIFGPDYHQSLYCHLLCGLLSSSEVQLLSSIFIHTLVQALRVFEHSWEELCSDIREGVLSPKITASTVREAMERLLLHPNPELADAIRDKCRRLSKGEWHGAIPELWPNAKYVCGIMTGAMEPYVKKLKHYAGGLPLVSSNYGASEGWVGVNVKPCRESPEEATFVVVPDAAYFEFMPLQEGGVPAEESVGIEHVKVGKEYEVLFTNFAGLYRYRLGDVVRVTGFYNSSPELRFLRRRNLLLTLNIDKTTESDLQLAVKEAAKLLTAEKLELIDFTSYVERGTSDSGRYVIFWELNGAPGGEANVLKACCDLLDRSFVDAGYISSRKANSIGPLELRVVRRGTFQKILEHSMKMGGSVSQFKVPRCVPSANRRLWEILSDNVVGSYFSTAYR